MFTIQTNHPQVLKNSHFHFNAHFNTQKVTICNQNFINFLTTPPSYVIILSWLYKVGNKHYCQRPKR
uniref:Uncharacterized protein n=1 Tax=Siphoviridae sp. ctLqe90 TaxID=2825456 RepID=A0A8S5Q386_9CAUD|nr:MAG TPA: hypothetical protein [Siphoviridae sp. ctLqe90]